jgi:hypothetical protein
MKIVSRGFHVKKKNLPLNETIQPCAWLLV